MRIRPVMLVKSCSAQLAAHASAIEVLEALIEMLKSPKEPK